jgi:hypothetical protein
MVATHRLGALLLIMNVYVEIVNLKPGGTIREKRRTISWEGRGV